MAQIHAITLRCAQGCHRRLLVQASGGRTAVAVAYGIVCHVSFVLGVAAMMAAMYFGMSRSLGALGLPWSWLANAALLIQFPVAHSLLLTARGRSLLARLAPPGTGSLGQLTPGFLESSNVDLSNEFANMIVAQRGFQANARTITTSDEVIQELVQLKR